LLSHPGKISDLRFSISDFRIANRQSKIELGAFQMGWEFLEGHTVSGFLEQIERMIAYPARLFPSDPSLNPFNPLPESVDSSPRQQRQLK